VPRGLSVDLGRFLKNKQAEGDAEDDEDWDHDSAFFEAVKTLSGKIRRDAC